MSLHYKIRNEINSQGIRYFVLLSINCNIAIFKGTQQSKFDLLHFSLAHAGFLPKYFSSKWSYARFQLPASGKHPAGGCPSICAFGLDQSSVIGNNISYLRFLMHILFALLS